MFTWRLSAYRSQLTRKGRNTLHNVSRLTKQARFRDPETKTNIVIGGDKNLFKFSNENGKETWGRGGRVVTSHN